MRGKIGGGWIFWLAGLMLPGCVSPSDARYVYQDSQFGVVAIPKNTPQGSKHYREQAEALMAQHFPQGYEIVRAEEVVEGSRTLTVGKTGNTELAPQVSPQVLALLKVGGSMSRSQADTMNLKECRIIYKKADPNSTTAAGGFAPEPSLTPTCYVDPKTEARRLEKETVKVSEAKKESHSTRAGESHGGE